MRCQVDAANPFSTEFKYSRFHAMRASPRNVAALAGKRRHVTADKISGGMGASMQGDDTLVTDFSADLVTSE